MEQRVSAILLAAGQSRRMGTCKQLLPLGDKLVIVRCLEAMIRAEIDEIIVVVNSKGDEIVKAIAGFPVKIERNEEPVSDMAESVRVGFGRIAAASTAVIISLVDHPLVKPETYRVLLERHRKEPGAIIIPAYAEKKGHPTLFPRGVLGELTKSLTLRDLLNRHSERVLMAAVPDFGVVLDMDTSEDYEKVKAIYSRGEKPEHDFAAKAAFHTCGLGVSGLNVGNVCI